MWFKVKLKGRVVYRIMIIFAIATLDPIYKAAWLAFFDCSAHYISRRVQGIMG